MDNSLCKCKSHCNSSKNSRKVFKSKKTKACLATEFWKQDKLWRRHASTRRKFGRTTSAYYSSFKSYVELSSSKPKESLQRQSHKLGDFRQQWEDYELGTSLEHRPEPVRLATLGSVMGKDCLEIFLNRELTLEERGSVTSSLKALEAYFKPKTNVA